MPQKWWVFISSVIAGLSLWALYYLVNNIWPEPQAFLGRPQLLFFTFTFLALSAGTMPVTFYLNHRFAKPGWFERDKTRLLRQSAWLGLFGMLLMYLQLIRALNWTIGLVLIGVFILIETFFLTRE
ncbi:MAG: hypothetical protein AB1801_07205 [Chloroflexota bacterium]